MAVRKREVKNKSEDVKENEIKNETRSKTQNIKENKKCECQTGNCIKSILISLLTTIVLTGCFILYIKQYQPEIYKSKIAIYFDTTTPVTTTLVSATTTTVTATSTSTQVPESTEVSNESKYSEKDVKDKLKLLEEKIKNDEILDREDKYFVEEIIKQRKIEQKIKNNPAFQKVKQYYDEPIGQMIKRISLENQVVLFINTGDEKSKIARLAISASKIPFGVMEVDTEPRAEEMVSALFRMTSQRSFPYIFINGKFFGTSLELRDIMKSHEFDRMLIEGKEEWLKQKAKYQKTLEKRQKDKEERERKRLEKIQKKILEQEAN